MTDDTIANSLKFLEQVHEDIKANDALPLQPHALLMPIEPIKEINLPRILYIGDINAWQYMSSALSPHFETMTVGDSASAFTAIHSYHPEVIIADVSFKISLTQKLKADVDMALILLAERSEEATVMNGLAEGADDYLFKPFSTWELITRIQTQVERIRAREVTRVNREHQQFLLKLSDRLRPLSEVKDIKATAARLVGEQLAADRALYVEYIQQNEKDYWLIENAYHLPACPFPDGLYLLNSFGVDSYEVLKGNTAIVPDVFSDPRISDLAKVTFKSTFISAYMAFPLVKDGKFVALLALHQATPRKWKTQELELLQEAAERIWLAIEHVRGEKALRESEARLAGKLADTECLQNLSSQLILGENINALYEQILDAAVVLMRSDMASLQMFYPKKNALQLLAARGFHPQSAKYWEWVSADSETPCGVALRKNERILIDDVEAQAFAPGSKDEEAFRLSDIRSVQSSPLISRNGKLVGMISTHWRKPHQISLLKLNFFDVLARQAADLLERNQTEQALKEADRRKDEFLATLAHELRNPLFPIKNAVYILKNNKNDLEQQQLIQIMERQVDHIVRLVDDLLEISRITTGKIELRKEIIQLPDVIHDAIEVSRPLLDKGEHELNLSLISKPLKLYADRVRLTQVFANLLNNAAKYTPQKGSIFVTAFPSDNSIIISVRDNGIGITPTLLPQVFDMFAQGKHLTKDSHQGLGIGLAMVRRIIELHGGNVEARSSGPNQGSEFIIRLPLWEANTSPQAKEKIKAEQRTMEATHPNMSQRVLVVDDNKDITDSLAMLLGCWKINALTVNNGEAALNTLNSFHPTIILLDIGMPDMNGYEVAKRIREQPQYNHIKLVALTGWGQEADRSKSKACGFNTHLTKPIDINLLKKLLQETPNETEFFITAACK